MRASNVWPLPLGLCHRFSQAVKDVFTAYRPVSPVRDTTFNTCPWEPGFRSFSVRVGLNVPAFITAVRQGVVDHGSRADFGLLFFINNAVTTRRGLT